MKNITKADLARVDVLMSELSMLNDLIESSTDDEATEKMRQERILLITEVNRLYGTDELMNGEKISVINND